MRLKKENDIKFRRPLFQRFLPKKERKSQFMIFLLAFYVRRIALIATIYLSQALIWQLYVVSMVFVIEITMLYRFNLPLDSKTDNFLAAYSETVIML